MSAEHIIISGIVTLSGIIILLIDYIKGKPFSAEYKKGSWTTTSIGFAIFLAGLISFATKWDDGEKSITNHNETIITNNRINVPSVASKKGLRVNSNLCPDINKLIAITLAKSVRNNVSDSLNLIFFYPENFLKHHTKYELAEYWPGAKVQIKSKCGSFEVDSDYIVKLDEYPINQIKGALKLEVNRIVKKHIDQICKKLLPCLQEQH